MSPLAEAAAAAGADREAVERISRNYRAWVDLERRGCTLNDGRQWFREMRKLAHAGRRKAYAPPVLMAVTDPDGRWPKFAAKFAEVMAEADILAEQAACILEARAADYTSGGRSNLIHLVAEPALVRLARELAALLPPGTATATVGGRLFCLVHAVHDTVTGKGERGVSHAIRKAGVARTCSEKRGSRNYAPASP